MKKVIIPIVFIASLLIGCKNQTISSSSMNGRDSYGDEMSDFLPEVGEVKLLFRHSKTETIGDDGEDYFYNYCPSIKIDNGAEHIYYCTNKDWGNITDYVGYRRGEIVDGYLEYSDESLVLEPTPDTWDQRHTCDPSVIKGEFQYEGESYSYMMAFLGCVPSDCTLNETGIAVAKNPEGPWVKCNGNRTDNGEPINPIVPYKDFGCKPNNWGTGQASLVSIDKKGRVLFLTTVGCPTGSFMDVREYDFTNINEYQMIRESKVFVDGVVGETIRVNNADFCYDPNYKAFLMAKGRSPFGKDGMTPNFIADQVDVYYVDASGYENPFDIFFDSERSEDWHYIATINQNLSGFPRNHNTGLITDAYGHMYNREKIGVAFTSSEYGTSAAMSYLKTYRIYATTFKVPYAKKSGN